MKFKMQEGEVVIKEGKANRSRLFGAQGGNLALTNKRLVFVGHGVNLGEGTISVSLGDVLTYGKAITFSIFAPIPVPNSIKIVTNDGKAYKFTVSKRKQWLTELEKALNK